MKMRSLTLSVFVMLLAFTACKKDSKETTPPVIVDTDEQLNPANGKFTHYLFNGNTRDTSGNNHHGGESGGLSYGTDRFNRSNRALVLNGTNADFEARSMKVNFPFSVSLWMNSSNASAVSSLFTADRDNGGSAYVGYWLQQSIASPGKLAFSFGDGTGSSGNSRNSLLSSVTLSSNQWYHIVVNVRGANDMDLYINGTKDNNAVYDGSATTIAYSNDNPFGLIGAAFAGQFYGGKIDDFRVYSRVLTPVEITSLNGFQP
jgi:hypothetical protein